MSNIIRMKFAVRTMTDGMGSGMSRSVIVARKEGGC